MIENKITEKELSTLILESNDSNYLACKYGPGWVILLDKPENDWAFKRLQEIRAIKHINDSKNFKTDL